MEDGVERVSFREGKSPRLSAKEDALKKAGNSEAPVMQGYMQKKGDGFGFLSRWQTRYFVLGSMTHELAWCETQDKYQDGGAPQNTLHCSDIQRVEWPPKEPTKLNLVTIGRVYHLEAEEAHTARTWYDCLHRMSQIEDESRPNPNPNPSPNPNPRPNPKPNGG